MRYVIYNLEVTSWHADQGANTSTGMTWLVVSSLRVLALTLQLDDNEMAPLLSCMRQWTPAVAWLTDPAAVCRTLSATACGMRRRSSRRSRRSTCCRCSQRLMQLSSLPFASLQHCFHCKQVCSAEL